MVTKAEAAAIDCVRSLCEWFEEFKGKEGEHQ